MPKSDPIVDLKEYASRRERLLKALKGAAAVIFAGEGAPPLLGKWRPDASFYYLTGLENEAGAAILFDPSSEDPDRRVTLFLRPLNPELERWDGYRDPIGSALKERTGFTSVLRASALPAFLTSAARRTKRLACLHRFSVYPAAVSPDLSAYRSVAERVPGVAIEDATDLIASMRAVKSPAELALMRQAIRATAAGYEAMFKALRPGVTEARIAQTLEQTYLAHGADSLAYNSIVGAGLNGTVLHYMENAAAMNDGDLVVIDSGASFRGYAADITRTLPVNGRYTPEQREVYETVLAAQLAAIKAARPGATMTEVNNAARAVIEKAGHGDAFIHGIGHQLGIEVHDISPDGPLKPGMVVTIEPGIYLPDRKLGVRTEDDILITAKGNENLTIAVPKTVKDVEAALK